MLATPAVTRGSGSVGVDEQGRRLGKGGGFSDLEFAIATQLKLIGRDTIVVTTVHETQIVGPGRIPLTPHDVKLDLIVTPERVIRCRSGNRPTASIRWDDLTDDKVAAIPVLRRLRGRMPQAISDRP